MGVWGVQPVSASGSARQVAAQMVSELFFKPVLAELRRSPWGAEFARGGQTEAIFGQQLDERIADIVATMERGGLVDQLAERLRPGSGAAGSVSWRTHLQAQKPAEMGTDGSS